MVKVRPEFTLDEARYALAVFSQNPLRWIDTHPIIVKLNQAIADASDDEEKVAPLRPAS